MRQTAQYLASLILLISACSSESDTVLYLQEDGTPLIRSLSPEITGNPFRLIKEVEFGDISSGEEARLFQPAGVVEVPGGIAVLDADSNTVKVYGNDGTLRLTVGGKGQGPGEFDAPRLSPCLSYDGRIFITDMFNLRFTWIDPLTGTFESRAQSVTWSAANVAEDQFVVIHPRLEGDKQIEWLELVDGELETVTAITMVKPGRVIVLPGSSSNPITVDQPMWPPFGWWVQSGTIATCQGDDFRIEIFDYEGHRTRIVEWAAPKLPVTDAVWDSIEVFIRQRYQDDWATVMQRMERPSQIAAVENLRIDGHGRIWVLRDDGPTYATHIEHEYLFWDIIDTDGSWLGTQTFTDVPWYFGTDVCYVIEQREQGAVVVRYRLVESL